MNDRLAIRKLLQSKDTGPLIERAAKMWLNAYRNRLSREEVWELIAKAWPVTGQKSACDGFDIEFRYSGLEAVIIITPRGYADIATNSKPHVMQLTGDNVRSFLENLVWADSHREILAESSRIL